MVSSVVLDSNILVKVFLEEQDSDQARELLRHLIQNNVLVLGPQLLITETIDVCLSLGVDPDNLYKFFDNRLEGIISIVELTSETIRTALAISTHGHVKSGFPSYTDSIYHAIAVEHESLFITADKRHLDKTVKKFGSVVLLKDWHTHFSNN